ncbi:hypothetical protein BB560_003498, partial [Smittium megazygosporum]
VKKEAKKGNSRDKYDSKISQEHLMPGEILVGQPDPTSNLRPIKLFIPYNETKAEKCYRMLWDRSQEYNSEFWTKNNQDFQKGIDKLEEKAKSENKSVSESDLENYFREYLNQSYEKHKKYNRGWWKLNLSLLIPGWFAKLDSLIRYKRRNDYYFTKYANSEIFPQEKDPNNPNLSKKSNFFDKNSEKLGHRENSDPSDSFSVRRKEKIDSYY